jgi:hypothetical protein
MTVCFLKVGIEVQIGPAKIIVSLGKSLLAGHVYQMGAAFRI